MYFLQVKFYQAVKLAGEVYTFCECTIMLYYMCIACLVSASEECFHAFVKKKLLLLVMCFIVLLHRLNFVAIMEGRES